MQQRPQLAYVLDALEVEHSVDQLARFLRAFRASSSRELTFVPEFPDIDPVNSLDVSALANDSRWPFFFRGTLLSADRSFLFTVDWDSFFTLFYGPLAFVPETVRQHGLEEVDESLMRSCILANEDPEVKAIELEWDEIRDAIEEPWSDAPTL